MQEVPKTVRFNVGGTVHEVSRSLILLHENSMLARAGTWQSNPEMAIFIDGDGERFRYCLDFMRHGRVHLPLAVSRAAILQDLDYYGIQVSDPSLIDGSCASVEAAEHMANKENNYSQTVSAYDEQIQKLQSAYGDEIRKLKLKRSSFVLAFECYKLYSVTELLDNLKIQREFGERSRSETPSQKQLLCRSAASRPLMLRDHFAYDPNDTDYEGSKANPFISYINTACPERNRDGFVGSLFDIKRESPNGDEYMLSGVVVSKTGNSSDIVDAELWKAEIPQPGDFHPHIADSVYVNRSLLVTVCALDILHRDAKKLIQENGCEFILNAYKATTARYKGYGAATQKNGIDCRQKKYYLLVFEKAVAFHYLSHDPDCRLVKTHSNMADFEKNYRDGWDTIVSTIQLGLTNAYWEVPFVGGRRKLESKKAPKKLTAAERIAIRNVAKLKTPDILN